MSGVWISRTNFALSLAQACSLHLGQAEGNPPVDFTMARHTIDLLEMLEEKTQGNLSAEEERIVSQVLSDLRASFIRVWNDAQA